MELSIILINYNTKTLTEQAIDSILKTVEKTDFEIVVVDNSSQEEQKVSFESERVCVLRDVKNHGFGHACNLGVQHSSGEYLLFLNSDTVMSENTIDESFAFLKQDCSIGALGVRMLRPDGSLDHGCKRGFPTPMASLYYFSGLDRRYPDSHKYGAYRQTFLEEDTVADVDSVSGAFLMLSRTVFDKVDGFDQDFFMYGEDLDLCYRIKQEGYRVVYYGKVSFLHLHGQSGLVRSEKVIGYFYDAMNLFYDKHYQNKYNALTGFLVKTAISCKRHLAIRKSRKVLEDG